MEDLVLEEAQELRVTRAMNCRRPLYFVVISIVILAYCVCWSLERIFSNIRFPLRYEPIRGLLMTNENFIEIRKEHIAPAPGSHQGKRKTSD